MSEGGKLSQSMSIARDKPRPLASPRTELGITAPKLPRPALNHPRDSFQKCFKFFELNLALMLVHLRNFSLRSLRPWSAASNTRLLSLSAVRQDDDQAQAGASESYDESAPHPEEDPLDARYSTDEKGFTVWLNREGAQFKTAHRARNWLGGSTTVRVLHSRADALSNIPCSLSRLTPPLSRQAL